jgi:excisionase family DNA binding protein
MHMHVEMMTTDQPLTRDEAARYLGVSRNTLSSWAARKAGPPYSRSGKVRGRVWYRVRDLDAWLESRHVNVEANR